MAESTPSQADIEDRLETMASNMSPAEVNALAHARSRIAIKRAKTEALLKKEEKVTVFVPDGPDESVTINGVRFPLKAGVEHSVPRTVAEMLRTKWKAQALANRSRQLDHGSI